MTNNKFGILAYNSINIGDEIQSIASQRFLPQIDEYIFREQVSSFLPENKEKHKLIMNAWWMWQPENFPPSEYVEPLMISMFFLPAIRNKIIKHKDYLIKHGPIGCRDMSTYNWLKENNIPAYFSGCLTLTLQRNYKIPRGNYILCVDTSDELVDAIKQRTNIPVYKISRMLSPYYTSEERLKLAKIMLRLYHDAQLVVSSRLHAILPSLAMETPVLRIISDKKEMGDVDRYMGYEDYFNTYTNEEIINNPAIYDFNKPKENPKNHLEIRNQLIKSCTEFTGYNNENSLLDENINPLIELIQINKNSYKKTQKILHFGKPEDIRETIKLKKLGCTKYDLDINGKIYKSHELSESKIKIQLLKSKILKKIIKKKREHYISKIEKLEHKLNYIKILKTRIKKKKGINE